MSDPSIGNSQDQIEGIKRSQSLEINEVVEELSNGEEMIHYENLSSKAKTRANRATAKGKAKSAATRKSNRKVINTKTEYSDYSD